MKITSIVKTRTALVAPLLALGLTAGAQNMTRIHPPKQQDEFVVSKNSTSNNENIEQRNKTNKSYAGSIFLGLLATFCGISLLAGDKKSNGGK